MLLDTWLGNFRAQFLVVKQKTAADHSRCTLKRIADWCRRYEVGSGGKKGGAGVPSSATSALDYVNLGELPERTLKRQQNGSAVMSCRKNSISVQVMR